MVSDPKEADRQFDLGDEYSTEGVQAMQAGDEEMKRAWFLKAIDAYSAALDATPPDDILTVGNLKLCIGARRLGLGELEAALALYAEALRGPGAVLLPRQIHAQARLNRAECRLLLGDVAQARAEVREVLDAHPDHPYAQHLMERCSEG